MSLLARVAKWQTRWLQVPVFERTWGFKSPLAHHMVSNCEQIFGEKYLKLLALKHRDLSHSYRAQNKLVRIL